MEYTEDIEIFYFLFAGTLGMFLLSAGVIWFVIFYQRKLYNHRLKLLELETTYQKNLVQSNMEEVENERMRISKDLHDEIGSLFSAIGIKFDLLADKVQPMTPETEKFVAETQQAISTGIKSIRRISHNMIPPALEMFGLVAALEDLCMQFQGGPSGLPIEFTFSENITEPPNKVSLVMFRIVQELIQNTIKHAGATAVRLDLLATPGGLMLRYRDNGKGFAYNNREGRKGMGLLNIESRVNILQAELQFSSEPGAGIDVIIKIPNQLPTEYGTTH